MKFKVIDDRREDHAAELQVQRELLKAKMEAKRSVDPDAILTAEEIAEIMNESAAKVGITDEKVDPESVRWLEERQKKQLRDRKESERTGDQ